MKTKNNFHVIFVSNDKSQKEMYRYMNEMPWAGVQYMGSLSMELAKKYGSSYIPDLKIVNQNGEVVLGIGDVPPEHILKEFEALLNKRRLTPHHVNQVTKREPEDSSSILEQIYSLFALFSSDDGEQEKPVVIQDIQPGEFVLGGIAGPSTNRYAVINGVIYSEGANLREGVFLKKVYSDKVVLSCNEKQVDLKM